MSDISSNDCPTFCQHYSGMVNFDEESYKRECGARLVAARVALGFDTMREFANHMNIKEDRYDKWEKGTNGIPNWFIWMLKRRHGITFEWIFDGDPSDLPHSLAVKATRHAS